MRALSSALLAALLLLSSAAFAGDTWTTPFTGVRRLLRTQASPALRAHVLEIDLDAPGVYLDATATGERRQTPSAFAKAIGAKAAVNGDFFSYSTYATSGLAAGNGAKWSDTADTSDHGVLAFNQDAGSSRVELYAPSSVTSFASWMKGVVSGHPRVLAANAVPTTLANWGSLCTSRHPRTAVGLSQNKRKLWIAVVDGRSTASAGMTCEELGNFMKGLGAYTALNLDGGGSSAMYVSGAGIVNSPSDGTERTVGNHLAVFATVPGQTGVMRGVVYEKADAGDLSKRIPGAKVVLSNGMQDIADSAGNWDFTVAPGTYTATASAPGYVADSETRTVTNGGTIYGSIGLTKSAVPADFDGDGVPDSTDNCDAVDNPDQANLDGDASGDVCDFDDDGDGLADEDDNCPLNPNPGQADADGDGLGNACDAAPNDAGFVPVDGGEDPPDPEEDAGVELDAGTPEVDAGEASDAGAAPDSGTTGDAGTSPNDAGSAGADSGTVIADAGTAGADAGAGGSGGGSGSGSGSGSDDGSDDVDSAVGCSATMGGALLPVAMLLFGALSRRRRR